ncbi:MAG: SDR family NAD(P)-dependent oxidoreductase [Deltaproteobacteria bacterium]|nr:SDR family NAD(P)-dependent oxidoreductase [Deltaproteobacteria bacterium]MBW2698428.1 SDR family NAD(P)-dependent oxidoreductase [Deltaproteobacteria bacterium]
MNSLGGRVAIVTGASRGIGKGCALELAAAGATVYVTGRTIFEASDRLPGSLKATVAEVEAIGGQAIAVACDHADDDQVAELFAKVSREARRLDVLVNNAFCVPANLNPKTPFWKTPISDWDVMIDVGTRSSYVGTHFASRIMVAQGSGLIVNISSAGAVRFFHHLAYGVGKAALDRITVEAARPLSRHGVAIVSLWPNLVKTERVLGIPGFDLKGAESQRFTGRAVVALAGDSGVMHYSGKAVTSRGIADAYGFKDVDGRLPDDSPWQPES